MTNPPIADKGPESFGDLPIQPTGSGVADLEIAYEQMELAQGADPASADPIDTGTESLAAMTPTETGDAGEESSAHPS